MGDTRSDGSQSYPQNAYVVEQIDGRMAAIEI